MFVKGQKLRNVRMCSKLRDYQLILHTYTHRDTHTHTHMAIDEPHSNCKPRIYHTHTNTHTRHPKITVKKKKINQSTSQRK